MVMLRLDSACRKLWMKVECRHSRGKGHRSSSLSFAVDEPLLDDHWLLYVTSSQHAQDVRIMADALVTKRVCKLNISKVHAEAKRAAPHEFASAHHCLRGVPVRLKK